MEHEARAAFLSLLISTPLMKAFPLVAEISPVNIFMVVVFPAPFGPRNPTHFVPWIFRFRSLTAVKLPNFFVTLTASRDGANYDTTFLNRYRVAPSVTIAISPMIPNASRTAPQSYPVRVRALTAFTA